MGDTDTAADGFLAGGGDMGARMRAHEWSRTPLGHPDAWPQSLRTSVSTCLNCAFPILVWWGPDLVKLYNDSYVPILGEKHPAALGRAGREVWPEIWHLIGPMLHGVLARGEPTRAEDLFLPLERHGYPEECYFSFSYSPIREESGAVGGVFCPVIETTGRVIGERRLRLLREVAQRGATPNDAADFAREAVACIAAGGGRDFPFAALYLPDDSGAMRLAGTAGAVAGEAAASLDGGAWPLAQAVASGTVVVIDDLQARLGRQAGDLPALPPERALVLPLGAGSGRPLGALLAALSPQRPPEEVRQFAELLAGQIASGLAGARAYAEERRRAAALAELDAAKTVFFSNVSHEFRTPLTLMLGLVEEVLAKPEEQVRQDDRRLLEMAHRSTRRLQKLVDTLLEFSRLEAGRITASYVPTDIAALTADLASSFRSAIERAGLRLTVASRPLPQAAWLDREMWEQVVLNLLSNAFKFTLHGEIRVETAPSADGRAAEVTVADTGVGIPAPELPRLFERFYRVPAAGGRSFEGTGIGLALVRELVQLHGGTLRVQSELGRGSAFTVAVPLGTAHLPAELIADAPAAGTGATRAGSFVAEAMRWLPGEPALPEPASDPPVGLRRADATGPGTAGHVLLADDNADMRAYIERLLVAAGFTVQTVADGEAALEAARRRPPDLVLSDVMMPRRDGFRLLAALREDAATAGVPVILLSARAGEDRRIEGIHAGADDYLVKPFNARELVARVEGSVRLARLRSATDHTLRAQKHVLELIATGAPLDRTLDEIARMAERQEPGARAAILRLDRDAKRFLAGLAPSLPDEFLRAFEGLSIRPPYTAICDQAADLGTVVAVPDVAAAADPDAGWCQLLVRNGFRAARSTPVRGADGEVVATFALYYQDARDPEPGDSRLIDVATHLIAIAIERDRADHDLREREERLRIIIDSAREYAILTTDPRGRISSWNSGAERLLGYSAQEAVGGGFDIFFTPEDRQAGIPRRELQEALAGGRAVNDRWHIRKDGTRFFASGITIPLASNGTQGLLTIFRDRTHERRLEAELARRNAELEALLEAAPVAVWFTHDPQASEVQGNRIACAWLNVPARTDAPASGPAPERFRLGSFPGGPAAGPEALPLLRAARGEPVWNQLLRVETPDGGVRDLICSAVPLRDGRGEVIGAVCTGTDVTTQIDSERRLRELTETLERRVAEALAEKKLFADLIERTDVFVQAADFEYRWLAINKASADEFERLFGKRPQPGKSMLDLLADQPAHQADVRAVWARALAGEEFTKTSAFGEASRRRRYYEMKFNTLRDPAGRPVGAYQFVYDVTERVENEARLAAAQAQLHEMQKLETIGQLTGGIAHDFNNLLTPIVVSLDLLRHRYGKDERAVRMIAGALQSAERARVLVGRLLAFARRQNLELRPVDVPDLVRDMAELIERSLGPQIDIRFDLPDGLPPARVDPNQLELALLNLCINARDAMPGGGRLDIAAGSTRVAGDHPAGLGPGSYVELAVRDTGTGMDAETLRRSIEPFYTTKGVGRGTGLGLSMVHGLAGQSGGALLLESQPGLGTTAVIYLPTADAPPMPAPAQAGTPPHAMRPLVILLVDDEDIVRMGVRDLLEDMGHRVVEADGGPAALQVLRDGQQAELLLTDYMMPGMTGIALAREARRLRPGLPALLITGYAALGMAGAEELPRIGKPLGRAELAAAIAAAMQDSAAPLSRRLPGEPG